jgi:hypothetical protein
MTSIELIGLITAILALIGGLELRVKAITKHYLNELKPNGGSSMKDQINRLEARVDTIIELLHK